MNSRITKRLDALESSFGASAPQWVVIWQWGHDSDQVREDKLARWRAGEDIEGAPTHTRDRKNINVATIQFVSPDKDLAIDFG